MEFILPFLCGLGTGLLSAWGIGGGTLLLLCMTLFLGVEQTSAQGINLLYFLPTAAASLYYHGRGGYLDRPTLRRAIPAGTVCALLAAWCATQVDISVLRKPFGILLLVIGVLMLTKRETKQNA